MSLFVAIRPPDVAVADLTRAVEPLRAADGPVPEGLRWAEPSSLHVTVVFLGAVPDERRAGLETRLARAAARHPAMTLAVAGGGCFGTHVLFAKLSGDVEALGRLAASVAAGARRAGVPVDDRPYRAHLTLARSRGRTSLRPLAEGLRGHVGPTWPATEVLLMESRPAGVAGRPAAYATVSRFPLRTTPA
jgi:RNA 2',3'-cyclic 3'-phosphodiesterase